MNRPRLLLILAALFCALNLAAQNQSLDALRDEIRRAEEEIRATNELLAKTKKDKQVTQNQLKLIQNRIRNRKQIIANLEKQTQVINGDIGTKNDTVHAMPERIDPIAERVRGYGLCCLQELQTEQFSRLSVRFEGFQRRHATYLLHAPLQPHASAESRTD